MIRPNIADAVNVIRTQELGMMTAGELARAPLFDAVLQSRRETLAASLALHEALTTQLQIFANMPADARADLLSLADTRVQQMLEQEG
jgi:hypothetical protein